MSIPIIVSEPQHKVSEPLVFGPTKNRRPEHQRRHGPSRPQRVSLSISVATTADQRSRSYFCGDGSSFVVVNTAIQPRASFPPAEPQTLLCPAGIGTYT